MSHLDHLKKATSLHDVAHLLGFTPKALAYVLHGIPDAAKYTEFEIPKRSGGKRKIAAPCDELRNLQGRLSELLQNCIDDINKSRQVRSTLSHGFRRKHSIATNADVHRNKTYVFNVDLRDFFNEINFGRVYGFFIKNKNFSLHPKTATILAQIACFKNSLPQGSPCSPVISNLIGHILDIRLATLASRSGCYYSRYADDLTFSSKGEEFPKDIAERVPGISHQWIPGKKLESVIDKSGFSVNPQKTRMQHKNFRQDVTGLVVNKKVNIKSEYAKLARSMTHRFLTTGEFSIERTFRDEKGVWCQIKKAGSPDQLHGILGFIDSIRLHEKKKQFKIGSEKGSIKIPRTTADNLDAYERVYRRFLTFKRFYAPALPTVICEGKTDNVYIRCAVRQLSPLYPSLIDVKKEKDKLNLTFFRYTPTTDRLFHLAGGTGDLNQFIGRYSSEFRNFVKIEKRNPVILIIDNDEGSDAICNIAKKVARLKTKPDGSQSFYPIIDNLYLIVLPKLSGKSTAIEDFFDGKILNEKLNGKSFSRSETFDRDTQYGKHLFAEAVVEKKQDEINFSGFKPILDGIANVIEFHAKK